VPLGFFVAAEGGTPNNRLCLGVAAEGGTPTYPLWLGVAKGGRFP